MKFEFDPAKNAANILKHGLSFVDFQGFDGDPVLSIDERADYGEVRYRAFGRIDGVAHCVVSTITEDRTRLISFRRAHEKEMKRHE